MSGALFPGWFGRQGAGDPDVVLGDTFSVYSWNILADSHITPSWYPTVDPVDLRPEVRWPRVLAALTALDADVVCLQEVPPERLPALRAALAPRFVVHAPHNGEGLLLASRAPILAVEDPLVGRKRVLVCRLAGGVRVGCVHLSWTGPSMDKPRPGLDQLRAALNLAPDVLVGDFNAFPDWPERLHARAAGLRDVGPEGPTCNVNQWLQPLDAVFVRSGWSATPTELRPIHAREPMPSAAHPSDHLGVGVTIRRG